MTGAAPSHWVVYVGTAVMLLVLNLAWHYVGRSIGRLVHRLVPDRLAFARRPLMIILAAISSIAITFVVFLIGLLALYAFGEA